MRCSWCTHDPLYIRYHDDEWGKPVHDDSKHFEYLLLESAQAGLSWLTILRRRENYRTAYAQFDPIVVVQYSAEDVERLMNDIGIIRNRAKIVASINNAQRFLEIQAEFGSFDKFIWSFTEREVVDNRWRTLEEIPATTPLSDRLAKEMKRRGFKFLGSTTLYAHLQAAGIVNDHLTTCEFR